MPVTIRVDPATDVVHIDGSGPVTLEDVLGLIDELASASTQVRGRNGIIHASRFSAASMTFDTIRRISDRVSDLDELFRGTRWAVVAPSDMVFGLARIYETLRADGSFEVRAFRRADDAAAWIRPQEPAL